MATISVSSKSYSIDLWSMQQSGDGVERKVRRVPAGDSTPSNRPVKGESYTDVLVCSRGQQWRREGEREGGREGGRERELFGNDADACVLDGVVACL